VVKKTIADYMHGDGRHSSIMSFDDVIKSSYGTDDNFFKVHFGHLPELKAAYREAKDAPSRWNAIRAFYDFMNPAILKEDHRNWATVYQLPFDHHFTPIERDAWHCIRCHNVVMYPQYPVKNFFIDFAHPKLKVALELDGIRFHDPEKDRIRDSTLMADDWTVYRITGPECYAKWDTPSEIDEKYDDGSYEKRAALRSWYTKTSEGVIKALKHFYYQRNGQSYEDHPHADFIDESLHLHRSRA
jgi:very-short-patch-repair endonuclease